MRKNFQPNSTAGHSRPRGGATAAGAWRAARSGELRTDGEDADVVYADGSLSKGWQDYSYNGKTQLRSISLGQRKRNARCVLALVSLPVTSANTSVSAPVYLR